MYVFENDIGAAEERQERESSGVDFIKMFCVSLRSNLKLKFLNVKFGNLER